ncbi:MAG TPA: protein kinase family protein [Telluria sp.]|nr:protein kinase family protein [Telluria sp.]
MTRYARVVEATRFHEAYQRACAAVGPTIRLGGARYRVLTQISAGANARLMLADRINACGERVVLKLAQESSPAGRLLRESKVLDDLQDDSAPGAAYFTQRLPQAIAYGIAEEADGRSGEALVLRNPSGFWGSLADVHANYPDGIDARHVVWMWRRTLDVLAYVHAAGWTHGAIYPDHLLVHPGDHGILIIGWAGAQRVDSGNAAFARDLVRAAWSMRALLCASGCHAVPALPESVPAPLAALLLRASEDLAWSAAVGARGMADELVSAAAAAFGAPKFIDFNPTRQL